MDISNVMNGQEKAKLSAQVDAFNKVLTDGREVKQELGKDDFLKILITQLQNQDPTNPMEDKQFIAQMAQFSTLEQMTNLSEDFGKMSRLMSSGQAVSLLGKTVDISAGNTTIHGKVSEVSGGEYPQVYVNGKYYDYSQVTRIRE